MDSLRFSTPSFSAPVMVADATRVQLPPMQPRPAHISTNFANASLHQGWHDVSATAMPADKTRVAPPHPHAATAPPRPAQTFIRAADDGAIGRAQENETRRQAQENINHTASLDPFAAQVNGYHDFGQSGNADWQKIGASPLEYTATMAQPELFGAINSARGIHEAVKDPSALNVGLAAVGAGSFALGASARLPGISHGFAHLAEGAEKVHGAMNILETGGTLGRIKEQAAEDH